MPERLQDHIHMDVALTGSPELSPIRKWKTIDRVEVPEVLGNMKISINGDMLWHVAGNTNGVHRRTRMRYVVKLADDGVLTIEEQKTILLNLHGQFVYLVDHWHCDDTEDHTAWIKPFLLHSIGDIVPAGPQMPFYTIPIELTSASLITNNQPKVGWILEDVDYGAIGATARL